MKKKSKRPVIDDLLPELTEHEQALARCEQSWCDFAYAVRTGYRFVRDNNGRVKRALGSSFVQVKQQFDIYRDRLNKGDHSAVLGALQYACKEGVPLPYWLARETLDRINQTYQTETTLHEAFGLSKGLPERGKKAANARKKRQQQGELYFAVHDAMEKGARSLNAALDQVLKQNRFSFGKTEARRLFNERERLQRLHLGKDKHR